MLAPKKKHEYTEAQIARRKAERERRLAAAKPVATPVGKEALHPHLRRVIKPEILNERKEYKNHGRMISANEFWARFYGKADSK